MTAQRTALVVLSSGIGNVVRWTPLVAVLDRLGYAVDVWLLSADYSDTAELLRGAREIRDVLLAAPVQAYDVVCLSHWSSVFTGKALGVSGRRMLTVPPRAWRTLGDSSSVAFLAEQLGWSGPLPLPFVVPSGKRFDLPIGTVALHAGCKIGWAQKRWLWFPALANRFEHVVAVGGAEDRIAEEWPAHVSSYVGQLSLPDTAALLSQCAALVCNDSGLQHVAAALGIPTFPIYGITRPSREAMPLRNVHPITNRSACHAHCATLHHGARSCPNAIACLTTLTPDTVAEMVRDAVPGLAAA